MWIWPTKRSQSSNADQVSKDHELENNMAWLFGKKQSGKLLRIFFATDLHGSQHAFRKFINAAKFYEANVLIMGGDVLGKSISRSSNIAQDDIVPQCRAKPKKCRPKPSLSTCSIALEHRGLIVR